MANKHLTDHVVTKRIKPDGASFKVAAGTGNITSDPVDTAGYEAVRFIIHFGAIVAGAVTSIKAREGAQADMGDGADLKNTGQTVADTESNKMRIVDIYQPQKRYVDLVTLRATQNSEIDSLDVELYGGRKAPVTQDASVAGAELHASPDEGTA